MHSTFGCYDVPSRTWPPGMYTNKAPAGRVPLLVPGDGGDVLQERMMHAAANDLAWTRPSSAGSTWSGTSSSARTPFGFLLDSGQYQAVSTSA